MTHGERLPTVLVVDDEPRSLEALERNLCEEFRVLTATSAAEAERLVEREEVDIVLCDQRMPGESGVQFLARLRKNHPDIVRIILSGYTDAEDIIAGLNEAGIYQYIIKPWAPEKLLMVLKNAARLRQLERENELLARELRLTTEAARRKVAGNRQRLRRQFTGADCMIRAADSPLNAVCDMLLKVAAHDVPVLITGESGTGKELAARILHYNSPRGEKPFVVENCGALPEELLASELFGHRRGAFTGAVDNHTGLFERADGGSVFLDEIGEISPTFQVKLLRVLQEGEIRPVGATKPRRVNVRIIAATNRDLEKDVRKGLFREDLYYRLATIVVRMPPLRERPMDIPPLASHLLKKACDELGLPAKKLSDEALDCMMRHDWPGNVRELDNEIRRMLVLAEDDAEVLDAALLSPAVRMAAPPEQRDDLRLLDSFSGTLKERLEALEARIIREALARHGWNRSRVARELGLSRVGLRNKMERYGIVPAAEGAESTGTDGGPAADGVARDVRLNS